MNEVYHQIMEKPFIPVFYHEDMDTCLEVFEACYQGGVRVFEFTNRGTKALENFNALVEKQQDKFQDCYIGIGTIMSKKAAEQFIKAGASFVVSPCFSEAVSKVCIRSGIPYFPGCMTIKEIAEAYDSGCSMVKVFPGEVVGTNFVKAAKAVLPRVKMMITGGVNRSNAASWFAAGADAVGLGSQVINISDKSAIGSLKETIRELFTSLQR